MHQLVPQYILEKYKRKENSGQFNAVCLFIDIEGFSSLTDELMTKGVTGSEELAIVMRNVFQPLIDTIYHYNGFVATLAGDAITALFPEESYNSIIQILNCASHLPLVFERNENQLELSARFGLAFGEVQWGIIEGKTKTQASYYFSGEPIDRAVESQEKAASHQILVHETLYREVADISDSGLEKVGEDLYLFSRRSRAVYELQVNEITPDTIELSQSFFPKKLLEQDLSGEFRQVINVFIQLPDKLSEQQFKIFMQTVFALQESYGGLLNRLDFSDKGTHLYLFWGAPTAFETDIECALSFVLDLRSQTDLVISAGLSYRMSHAGFIGSSFREEYTCYGRGVNLAARLMTEASSGEIWIDSEIAKRAKGGFELELKGLFKFKGFSEKENVFVLNKGKEQSQNFFDKSLIARTEELETLAGFIEPLKFGNYTGNFLVVGEAGIGKSHLLHEFENNNQLAKECLWLRGQTDQILRTSLNPFRYLVKTFFGISNTQTESRNKHNFNQKLNRLIESCPDSDLAVELDQNQSSLGALVGLRWSDSLYEGLEPKAKLETTFSALRTLFLILSLEQAIIILIEDVHWLDTDSKSFLLSLSHLLNLRSTYPIAILMTARPLERVNNNTSENEYLLPNELSYEQITLEQLSSVAILDFIELILGTPAEKVLATLVTERSQGNPFFAEQIIRFMQEELLIEQIDNIWRLTNLAKKLPEATLPTDVRTVLIARIDRLNQNLKELVQTAAILGREFEVQLLSQMVKIDQELSIRLDEAETEAIWIALNELRYLFKHALLRDAVYDMQLVSRRKTLHSLAVEAFEMLYETDLSNHYAELAYHSEQAELTQKARKYLELAGDSAKEASQNEQAIDYYSRALALTPKDDIVQTFELKLKREYIYHLQGKRDLQVVELEELSRLAEQLDNKSQVLTLLRQIQYQYVMSLFDELIQTAHQALLLCNEEHDSAHLYKLHIFLGLAFGHHTTGADIEKVRTHYRLAANYAERSDDENHKAEIYYYLGEYYRSIQDIEQAQSCFEEGITLTKMGNENATSFRTRGNCLMGLAIVMNAINDLEKAKYCLKEALEVFQKIGDKLSVAKILFTSGQTYLRSHDDDKAEAYFMQAANMGEELQDRLSYTAAFSAAVIPFEKGQLKTALLRCNEIYKTKPKSRQYLFLLNLLAQTSVRLGFLREAETNLKQFLEALPPRYSYNEMLIRRDLVMLYLDLGDSAKAINEISKVQLLLENPAALEAFYTVAIGNLDVHEAANKTALASIALVQKDEVKASQLMNDVVSLLERYKLESFELDASFDYPDSRLFYYTYTVLKTLNRSEATIVLNEAYRRIMDLSQKIGKTGEAQKQVWSEDRFRRSIVEAWQAERYSV